MKTPCIMKMRSSESPRMPLAPESSIRTPTAWTTRLALLLDQAGNERDERAAPDEIEAARLPVR
jgi:hypothetical protein